jgi:hypothetical protein
MGHINSSYGLGAKQRIHGSDKQIPVRGIKALARFVQNQQPWSFDQGASEQNHALLSGRTGIERTVRGLHEAEPGEPTPGQRAPARGRRVKESDGVVETRRNDFLT